MPKPKPKCKPVEKNPKPPKVKKAKSPPKSVSRPPPPPPPPPRSRSPPHRSLPSRDRGCMLSCRMHALQTPAIRICVTNVSPSAPCGAIPRDKCVHTGGCGRRTARDGGNILPANNPSRVHPRHDHFPRGDLRPSLKNAYGLDHSHVFTIYRLIRHSHSTATLRADPAMCGNCGCQVAALFEFSSEKEAIQLANDTPFGLASYVYTRDIGRVWRVSEVRVHLYYLFPSAIGARYGYMLSSLP
eukprot:1566763-Pyramimonas_sp.AAC.1